MMSSNWKWKTAASLFFSLCIPVLPGLAGQERPQTWSQPVPDAHVGNLFRIEPDLYRSSQPDAKGFEELQRLGITSVLCLRSNQDDLVPAKDRNVHLLHVSMKAWSLKDDQVVKALRIMTDPHNRPLLVHCQHGADRTGGVVAMYRIVVQGWTKDEAIREMKQGGYHFHSIWGNISGYIQKTDVAWFRAQIGLSDPTGKQPGQ